MSGICVCPVWFEFTRHIHFVPVVAAPRVGHLYERFAFAFDSRGCLLSGRALRAFAALEGRSAREVVRNMPPREWNHEA